METKARTFIATPVPYDIAAALTALPKEEFPPMRWTVSDQFHMTLKFLGEIPESSISQVNAATTNAVTSLFPSNMQDGQRSLRILVQGLGAFPSPKRARIVWAGLSGELKTLHTLQRTIDNELYAAGFPKDTRPFKPHITLARSQNEPSITRLVERFKTHSFGSWTLDRLYVIESQLSSSGPRYITRQIVQF